MTLDEAIKHCEEVAEENDLAAGMYEILAENNHNAYERLTAETKSSQCAECAADYRQLAEWLTELKELRSKMDACNILAVDAFAVENLCKELKEAKRLLKAAVEDINFYVDCYEAQCDECCCDHDNHCHWKHEAEALALIGGEEQ